MLIIRYYIQIHEIISFLKRSSEDQKAYLLLMYNSYVYNLIINSNHPEIFAIQQSFQNPYSNRELSSSLFTFHYLEAEKIQEMSKSLQFRHGQIPEGFPDLNMTDKAGMYNSKILSSIYGSIFPLASKKKINYILRDLMPTSEDALRKVFNYQENLKQAVEKISGPDQNRSLFDTEKIGEKLIHLTSPILPDFLKDKS